LSRHSPTLCRCVARIGAGSEICSKRPDEEEETVVLVKEVDKDEDEDEDEAATVEFVEVEDVDGEAERRSTFSKRVSLDVV
jgi:hypothetical protein